MHLFVRSTTLATQWSLVFRPNDRVFCD